MKDAISVSALFLTAQAPSLEIPACDAFPPFLRDNRTRSIHSALSPFETARGNKIKNERWIPNERTNEG